MCSRTGPTIGFQFVVMMMHPDYGLTIRVTPRYPLHGIRIVNNPGHDAYEARICYNFPVLRDIHNLKRDAHTVAGTNRLSYATADGHFRNQDLGL